MYLEIKRPKRIRHRVRMPLTDEGLFLILFGAGVVGGCMGAYMFVSTLIPFLK